MLYALNLNQRPKHYSNYWPGEENILDARYLPVNRLASKCIQGDGLNSISQPRDVVADRFGCRQASLSQVGV